MSSTNKTVKVIGLVLSIIIVAAAFLMPATETFSHQALTAIGLLLALAVMWITTPIPLGGTAILILALMALLGVAPSLSDAAAGFANGAVFFAIVIFCLPVVVMKTQYGVRLVGWLVERVHGSSKRLVFLFMAACAILSTVLSDFCVTIIFFGFALTILSAANADPAHSNLGKCLMIGIPVAAVIGGMSTPVGGNFNILALSTMEAATGETITFFQWMAIGLPIAIVMVPIAWFFLTLAFKPEPIEDSFMDELRGQAADVKELSIFDKKAGVIFVITLIAWIASSWIPGLDATTVTIIAMAVMMLPGVELLTFDEMKSQVPWDIVLVIGTIISLGKAVITTGGASAVAKLIMGSGLTGLPIVPLCLVAFAIIYLLHTFFPIGAAIIAIFVPILIPVFAAAGISPVVPTVAIAVCVAGNFLLPFNPTVALTFGKGYYNAAEMIKFGVVPAIALIMLMSLWIPFISTII